MYLEERFPNNHLVAAATSNPPIPLLQPVAGGDKRSNNKEAKQSTVNKCFVSKSELPFDSEKKKERVK